MKHNEENERIKRAYRLHLKAARGLSDASVDVAIAAIHRFEESTRFRSFKNFTLSRRLRFGALRPITPSNGAARKSTGRRLPCVQEALVDAGCCAGMSKVYRAAAEVRRTASPVVACLR
jgi:hypothetical protein